MRFSASIFCFKRLYLGPTWTQAKTVLSYWYCPFKRIHSFIVSTNKRRQTFWANWTTFQNPEVTDAAALEDDNLSFSAAASLDSRKRAAAASLDSLILAVFSFNFSVAASFWAVKLSAVACFLAAIASAVAAFLAAIASAVAAFLAAIASEVEAFLAAMASAVAAFLAAMDSLDDCSALDDRSTRVRQRDAPYKWRPKMKKSPPESSAVKLHFCIALRVLFSSTKRTLPPYRNLLVGEKKIATTINPCPLSRKNFFYFLPVKTCQFRERLESGK